MEFPTLLAVESPYKGTSADPAEYDRQVRRNEAFAEAVCRYATLQGFSPYAMHLHNTRYLNDRDPQQRTLGIACGLAWTRHAEVKWFALRPEDQITDGMWKAVDALDGREAYLMRFTQEGDLISSTRLTPETIAELRTHRAHAA